MARPREFDRDAVLGEAIKVFTSHGYEGASTQALLDRMGISRQSLYDTFGDKRRLYLESLQRYSSNSTAEIIGMMNSKTSPRKGLETALLSFAARPASRPEDGCLGVGAISEFGRCDRDVNAVSDAAGSTMLSAVETLIRKGKTAGEFAASLDAREAAQFIAATLAGIKVSARGGATPETLRAVVRIALRSLE
jgi:TetR/AcrR family transcriptional repressor of nem operon